MKKYGKEVVIVLLFALACAALFLLSGETFTLLSDATADRLLQETLARAVTFALLLPVLSCAGADVLCTERRRCARCCGAFPVSWWQSAIFPFIPC